MKLRIQPHHALVFCVTGRQKVGSFYTPYNSEEYFKLQDAWVAQLGEKCHVKNEGVKVGSKCKIRDFFEVGLQDREMVDMWPHIGGDAFPEVSAMAEKYDGRITTCIIHEDSLMAVEV